jgi:hypothetical protein
MRFIFMLLLEALLLSSSGCITYSAVQEAKGKENTITGNEPKKAHPACYALLPLTVPADIATSPVQLAIYLFWYAGIHIYGGE